MIHWYWAYLLYLGIAGKLQMQVRGNGPENVLTFYHILYYYYYYYKTAEEVWVSVIVLEQMTIFQLGQDQCESTSLKWLWRVGIWSEHTAPPPTHTHTHKHTLVLLSFWGPSDLRHETWSITQALTLLYPSQLTLPWPLPIFKPQTLNHVLIQSHEKSKCPNFPKMSSLC